MNRNVLVASAVAGLVAVAGCSSDSGSGTTPKDFVRGDAKVLSVAYPKDWQRGPEPDLPLSMQAPGQTAFLSVIRDLSPRGNANMLESAVEAGPMLQAKGYHRTGTKTIKVPGAREAKRIDYTFTDYGGAAGKPGQAVDVGLIGKNGHVHTVRITWERGRLTNKVVDRIVDSIKVV